MNGRYIILYYARLLGLGSPLPANRLVLHGVGLSDHLFVPPLIGYDPIDVVARGVGPEDIRLINRISCRVAKSHEPCMNQCKNETSQRSGFHS